MLVWNMIMLWNVLNVILITIYKIMDVSKWHPLNQLLIVMNINQQINAKCAIPVIFWTIILVSYNLQISIVWPLRQKILVRHVLMNTNLLLQMVKILVLKLLSLQIVIPLMLALPNVLNVLKIITLILQDSVLNQK